MRKHVIGAAIISMAPGLTACGSGEADDEVSDKDKTLTVWIMEGTNPDPKPFFNEVSAAFKKKTGAGVKVEYQQWATAQKKFTTAIEGGPSQIPDVAEVGSTWVPQFAETGGLVDVTDQVKKAGLSPAKATTWTEKEVAADFQKGRIAMNISGNWTPTSFVQAAPEPEGKLAAAPIPGETGGMSDSFLGGSYLSTFQGENQELASGLAAGAVKG